MNETCVAYRNPNPAHHTDFPDVTVAPDGTVVMILRRCGQWAHDATLKFERPLTFFEAEAEILTLRSTDGGRSFSEEGCLFTGLAYDPMITTLSDGRLLAGAVIGQAGSPLDRARMQGVLHRHLPQLDTVITVRGVGLWQSADGGRTWPAEPQLVALEGWENTYNLRRPFQLDDDTITMPVTVGYPWRTRYVGLLRSWDEGRSWADPSFVAEDAAGRAHYAAGVGYWQPAMSRTPDGDLVCVCVLDDRDSAPQRPVGEKPLGGFAPTDALPRLYRTHSVDSGFTWSLPQDSGLQGDFPSMVALLDGRLLLTHTQRRRDGSSVLAHVSDDGGVAWRLRGAIRDSSDRLFYYPHTVVLPDRGMLTVCMTQQPDQVRVVEATRWELQP